MIYARVLTLKYWQRALQVVAERPRIGWGVVAILGFVLMFMPVVTPILWLMQFAEWVEAGARSVPALLPIAWVATAFDHVLGACAGFVMFSQFWAVPVWWLGACGLWLCGREPRRTDVLAVLVALGGNGLLALSCVPFFYAVPAGASIRPMGWAFWTFVAAGWTALTVLTLGLYALLRERRFLWLIAVIPLVVESFSISGQLLRYAARVKGFELSD